MEWTNFLIAVSTATALHRLMEPNNINYKLKRLSSAIKTGKIEVPPMKGIDTRAKAYALGLMMVIMVTAIGYFVAGFFDSTTTQSVIYSVVVLLFADVVTMIAIDKYHADIEKITKSFGKK